MNALSIFSTAWVTKLVTLLNPFYVKQVETYNSVDNVQSKNTISQVATISGAGGSSPTVIITKRCKCWIVWSSIFNGSTNGVGTYLVINGTDVATPIYGANPNAGISGGGSGYNSILEVGDVLSFNWGASVVGSRDTSILLEEI